MLHDKYLLKKYDLYFYSFLFTTKFDIINEPYTKYLIDSYTSTIYNLKEVIVDVQYYSPDIDNSFYTQ